MNRKAQTQESVAQFIQSRRVNFCGKAKYGWGWAAGVLLDTRARAHMCGGPRPVARGATGRVCGSWGSCLEAWPGCLGSLLPAAAVPLVEGIASCKHPYIYFLKRIVQHN